MSHNEADFVIYCENGDVEDSALLDVSEYWQELGQEQRSDHLSAVDALQYGDRTYLAGHYVQCTGSYFEGNPAQLTITVH